MLLPSRVPNHLAIWFRFGLIAVSVVALVALAPVVFKGMWRDRLLGLILAVFPSLVLLACLAIRR